MERYIWKYFGYDKIIIPKTQHYLFPDKDPFLFINKTSSDDILVIANIFNGSSTLIEYNTIFELFKMINKKIITFTNIKTNETLTINNNKEGQFKLIYECLKNKIEVLPLFVDGYKKSENRYGFNISYKDKPWFIEVIKDNWNNIETFNYKT